MTTRREIGISVDLGELEKNLKERREALKSEGEEAVRSTVFTFGKDPRISSKPVVGTPEIYLVEILKDGLDNPYIKLHWRVNRFDVDSGSIVGFNVFRRRLKDDSIPALSRAAFDRLSRKNKRVGKFSAEKKAINNVKKGAIPLSILNPNLHKLALSGERRQFAIDRLDDEPDSFESDLDLLLANRKTTKIGYVDYSKFLAFAKNRRVFVSNRDTAEVDFQDKSVGYGETFEYHIVSVPKEIGELPKSNVVRVTIADTTGVRPPETLRAKQATEKEIHLAIKIDSRDKVESALIFRKAENEIVYEQLVEATNTSDCINMIDGNIRYGQGYSYRVFLKNIHGTISEPGEASVFASVQKVTPQTRSNNLRIPVFSAVQDQNSSFVKLLIAPNDPGVSYYEIKRRDLTIGERKFAVPSKTETLYGGDGWETNKFFVEKETQQIGSQLQTVLKPITFIDDTVHPGRIYQYQTRGYDLYGNGSSYALSTVKAEGIKTLRTPINLRSEILRNFPFRVKIKWDDDNDASAPGGIIKYRIQRRKFGEKTYETFPVTENNFIVDEIATTDFVKLSTEKAEDTFGKVPNRSLQEEGVTVSNAMRRAFKLPDFLIDRDIYFYRIAALTDSGEESNYSEEFKLTVLPELSDPINFSVDVENAIVRPLVAHLNWGVDLDKARPDHWVIERKVDSAYDTYSLLGKAYLATEFFDRTIQPGNQYLYRIKSVDTLGRESPFFELRLVV
jgi:hypothetical protein